MKRILYLGYTIRSRQGYAVAFFRTHNKHYKAPGSSYFAVLFEGRRRFIPNNK
jgi:hypothetical protein